MKTASERIDPQLAEALAALPKSAAGVFDLNDLAKTRAAVHQMGDAANAAVPDDGSVSIKTIEVPVAAGINRQLRKHVVDAVGKREHRITHRFMEQRFIHVTQVPRTDIPLVFCA